MATKKVRRDSAKRAARAESLDVVDTTTLMRRVADRLGKSKGLRKGMIVMRLRGAGGGDFCMDCTSKSARLLERMPRQSVPPLIEVIGEAGAIQEVLQRKANPVAHFLRGRFRVRGDLQYLSDLAMEFELIKEPL
jgi:hypothetical protein